VTNYRRGQFIEQLTLAQKVSHILFGDDTNEPASSPPDTPSEPEYDSDCTDARRRRQRRQRSLRKPRRWWFNHIRRGPRLRASTINLDSALCLVSMEVR